jgi:DNA modification methylase
MTDKGKDQPSQREGQGSGGGGVSQLLLGDCLEVMRTLSDCSVDAVVTDPPYGLADHPPKEVAACLAAWLAGEPYKPKGKGFMGKAWDAWVPGPEVWRECLRVLKPGGHLLAFAGTRSMDLMSMAVRLAGFELRDSIGWAHDGGGAPLLAWTYGSGFPKSLDVSKAIDKAAGMLGAQSQGANYAGGDYAPRDKTMRSDYGYKYAPATPEAQQWAGWGTALKPSWEPVILARKPLEGTVAANVLAHGAGGINVDGCRVGTSKRVPASVSRKGLSDLDAGWGYKPLADVVNANNPNVGRFPANFIHDGSDEVVGLFPQTASGGFREGTIQHSRTFNVAKGVESEQVREARAADTGSAARFFYTAKASRDDRSDGNTHPTVKPTDLMRYLCRLVTPPGGVVLDPFMGSGSTGKAAMLEGFEFIGIEREAAYHAIAERRIGRAAAAGYQPSLLP